MQTSRIINRTRSFDQTLVAFVCQSFLCKLRGLSFRRSLPEGQGLLMVMGRESKMDSAIHMFGMFFDLGIIWIDKTGMVVDKVFARKWITIRAPKIPATYVLEVHPEWLDHFQVGDQIEIGDE